MLFPPPAGLLKHYILSTMDKGYIKLFRDLREWEWYQDDSAVMLLVHLLITVNYEDKKWKGIIVPSGSVMTSWEKLASELNWSVKRVRNNMKKLEDCGEVTREYIRQGQVNGQLVSLVKWDKHQSQGNTEGRSRAGQGQVKGTLVGNQLKKEKKEKKEKNINPFIVPLYEEFRSYALEKQPNTDVEKLKLKYEAWKENNWRDGNNKLVKNWKSKLLNTLPYLKTQQKQDWQIEKDKQTKLKGLQTGTNLSDPKTTKFFND